MAPVERYGTKDGRWIAMAIGGSGGRCVYRKSWVNEAGYDTVPADLDGFLDLCRKLKENGHPPGLALGNAVGDGNAWTTWVTCRTAASCLDKEDNVVIDSPETVESLKYAEALYETFIPGTLSWLDPSNNKAFLAGELGLTQNGISIYYAAKNSEDPAIKEMAADIFHAPMPIGPVGFPTERALIVNSMIFGYTPYPNAAKEYLRFMMEEEQYAPYLEACIGYWNHPLKTYDKHPIWTEDPKHEAYKHVLADALWDSYEGSISEASSAVLSEFVVVQMVASVCAEQATPEEAAAEAPAPHRALLQELRRSRGRRKPAPPRSAQRGVGPGGDRCRVDNAPRGAEQPAPASARQSALPDLPVHAAGGGALAPVPDLSARARHLARLHRHQIGRDGEFVGLWNYESLYFDRVFWLSVTNTILYTVVATIGKFALGLWLALLLNHYLPFKAFIRSIVLVPWIVPTVLSAIAFWWIYDPQFSIISYVLVDVLGWRDTYIDFLGVPSHARASLIAANIWRGIPFVAICLLAGLQTISPSLYEAAMIDGANAWRRFWHITLPMLMPILAVVLTFSVLFTFTDFQLVYAITRGGPVNSTHLMATLAFQRGISGGPARRGRGDRRRHDPLPDRRHPLQLLRARPTASGSRGGAMTDIAAKPATDGRRSAPASFSGPRCRAGSSRSIRRSIAFLIVLLFPFYWMAITTFKSNDELTTTRSSTRSGCIRRRSTTSTCCCSRPTIRSG